MCIEPYLHFDMRDDIRAVIAQFGYFLKGQSYVIEIAITKNFISDNIHIFSYEQSRKDWNPEG